MSSKCGANTDTDTNTLLPLKAIFCQWGQFLLHDKAAEENRARIDPSPRPPNWYWHYQYSQYSWYRINPPTTCFKLIYNSTDIQVFSPPSNYLHSRMYRMAIRYPLFFRHSRIAWTAASEELKVGSEQELSWTGLLSSVKEAAADLRLVFNSFSSLDMLVSCERGGRAGDVNPCCTWAGCCGLM